MIWVSVATLVDDAAGQQQADLVDHHELAGIGDGDQQTAVRLVLERHEVVTEHQVDRDLAEQLVLDVEVLQIHKLATITPRQILTALDLIASSDSAAATYEDCFWWCCHLNPSFKFRVSSWQLALST